MFLSQHRRQCFTITDREK